MAQKGQGARVTHRARNCGVIPVHNRRHGDKGVGPHVRIVLEGLAVRVALSAQILHVSVGASKVNVAREASRARHRRSRLMVKLWNDDLGLSSRVDDPETRGAASHAARDLPVAFHPLGIETSRDRVAVITPDGHAALVVHRTLHGLHRTVSDGRVFQLEAGIRVHRYEPALAARGRRRRRERRRCESPHPARS